MRNKLVKARPHSDQKAAFSIHQDDQQNLSSVTVVPVDTSPAAVPPPATTPSKSTPSKANLGRSTPHKATPTKSTPSKGQKPSHEHPSPRSTLKPASEGTINSAMSRTTTSATNGKTASLAPASSLSPRTPNRMNSTIRTVPSVDERQQRDSEEDSSTDGATSHSTSRDSGFSSSLNSTASMSSSHSQQRPQATISAIPRIPSMNKLKLSPSGTTQDSADGPTDGPPRERSLSPAAAGDPGGGGGGGPPASNDAAVNTTEANLANGWDNSVGKAGLGKTGRVINRLVSDNEALKRDIQIERLRAEESRQTARLLEDKLERVISDYESRLLEANVTKTLLARKERQVESLQDTVELERKRAVDAADRERVWKDELEKTRADAKRRVEDATNHAALCEGRYNAISSHWKDQGEEVKRSMGRMREEVKGLVVERKKDDEKIETLRELCDQQDGNIRDLTRQKEEMEAQFERYKRQQEEDLRAIKTRADEREREQERTLAEAREVLDKLRWALNVKGKIEWAQ